MHRMLNYAQATRLLTTLARLVCSTAWLEQIAPRPLQNGWSFDDEQYPPGGGQTRMRFCAVCETIAPPNLPMTHCFDCETELSELRFLQFCKERIDEGIAEFIKRWWELPLRFAGEPDGLFNNPWTAIADMMESGSFRSRAEEGSPIYGEETADSPDGRPPTSRTDDAVRRSAVESACYRLGIPCSHTRFYDPIPASSLKFLPPDIAEAIHELAGGLPRESAQSVRQAMRAFRQICQSLPDSEIRRWRRNIVLRWQQQQFCLIRYSGEFPTRNVSINSGRSAGCELDLLSATEAVLRKEIGYFQQHGRIVPSARRFSRPRPHLRAPEDNLRVEDCFGARKPTSTRG